LFRKPKIQLLNRPAKGNDDKGLAKNGVLRGRAKA
jgi:hypothetical protein